MIDGDSVVILTKAQADTINAIFDSQKAKIAKFKQETKVKDSIISLRDTLLVFYTFKNRPGTMITIYEYNQGFDPEWSVVEKKYRLLTELNFGDALYKKTESELDNLTARLKSDMMLSQTKEQMFITQWKTIQKSIESSLDYGTARRLIDKLGKSGDPRVSIDAFVAWTEKNAKNVTFLDVIKRYKTFGEYMSDTNIAKWSKEYKEVWAKEAVYLQKVKSTLMLILRLQSHLH